MNEERPPDGKAAERKRLAEALRDNLKRRKAALAPTKAKAEPVQEPVSKE